MSNFQLRPYSRFVYKVLLVFTSTHLIQEFPKTMSTYFGPEFDINWPETLPAYTKFGSELLKNCINVERPVPLRLEDLVEISDAFPIEVI